MTEPTDRALSEWLRPVTATLTGDDVKDYQEAIALIAAQLSPESCFDLVELACGVGSAEANEWILDLARSKKGDIPLADNAALLARLACGAAIRALGGNSYATLLGLVVESAGSGTSVAAVPPRSAEAIPGLSARCCSASTGS